MAPKYKEKKDGNVRVLEFENYEDLPASDLERLGIIDEKERTRRENSIAEIAKHGRIQVPEKVEVPLEKRRAPPQPPGGYQHPAWVKALDVATDVAKTAAGVAGLEAGMALDKAKFAGEKLGLRSPPPQPMGPVTGELDKALARLAEQGEQAPLPAQSQHARPAAPRGPSMAQRAQVEMDQAYGMATDAAAAQRDVAAQQAQQEAMLLEERLKQQQALELKQNELQAKRTQALDAQQQELQKSIADFRDVNTTVDPGRLYGSRTVGQKVMGAIGLIFGALGAPATGGENRAVTLMRKIIDDDIALQKDQINANLTKAKGNIDNQRNLYGLMRDRFQDDIQALSATKLAMIENFETQLGIAAAKAKTPDAQAKFQAAAAAIEMEKAKTHAQFAQQAEVNAQKWAEINLDRQKLMLSMSGAGGGKSLPAEQGDKLARLEAGKALLQEQFDKMLPNAPSGNMTGLSTAEKVGKFAASKLPEPFSNEHKIAKQESEFKAETAIKAIMGEALMEADVKRAHKHAFMPWDDRDVLTAKMNYWRDIMNKRLQTSTKVFGASYDVSGVSAPSGRVQGAYKKDKP